MTDNDRFDTVCSSAVRRKKVRVWTKSVLDTGQINDKSKRETRKVVVHPRKWWREPRDLLATRDEKSRTPRTEMMLHASPPHKKSNLSNPNLT